MSRLKTAIIARRTGMILPIAFYDHIVLSAVREVIVQTDAIPHKIDVSDVKWKVTW